MEKTKAVYAGSFDPVTFGHLDLVGRAAKLFDHVIVAVGIHPTRHPLFDVEQRVRLLEHVTTEWPNVQIEPFEGIDLYETTEWPNVQIDSFEGLLVNYCASRQARVIIRGLRVSMDFEYEVQIAHANADMAPEIDTIFLPTRTDYGFITASLVREIASHHGDVSRYAPKVVCQALAGKFA